MDPVFGQGEPQLLRVKVSNIVGWSHAGEVNLYLGGSLWVLNAQTCILPHSRDTFSLIFYIDLLQHQS